MRCSYVNDSHSREEGDLGLNRGEGGVWMVGKTRADKLIFVNDNRHQPYPRGEGRGGGDADQGGGAGGRKGGREGGRKER